MDYCAKRCSPIVCKIGPSVLNTDLANLHTISQKLLDDGADYLHLDVMDGNFVPNLTFGHPVVQCLRRNIPNAFFETHMMVTEPEKWIESMADAKVNQYTFHVEPVMGSIPHICRKIREAGMLVGLAVKPTTSIDTLSDYIEFADMVLVMTVEPGFGGQSFLGDMMRKVMWLRDRYPLLNIGVDGGVTPETIHICGLAGANMIVSGTAVTNSDDPKKVMAEMKAHVNQCLKTPYH